MRKSMLLWGAVIADPRPDFFAAADQAVHLIGGLAPADLDRPTPCDDYDVKLVDEDGDSCVVGGVTLCADSDAWVITDEDLLACQVVTEE